MSFPSFPGQNQQAPVAPTPVAGGFAPVAPQAHVPPQGFAPQPGGGFTGQPAPAQPVYQQPAQAYAPQPQAFAPQPQFAPQQPAHGQPMPQPQATAAVISEAERAALRGAQMGKGKREMLPVGQFVVVGETTEFYDASGGRGAPNRALALLFTVETSHDNPAIQPGHRAKISEFLDTIYAESRAKQVDKFKQFVGRLYGAQSKEQLDQIPWENQVIDAQTSEVFKGARYHISVTPDRDSAGRAKIDKNGREKTRALIQRIG
jgi:hypothetical protein